MKVAITRRRFVETGLLTLFAGLGNAHGKPAPKSSFGALSTAEEVTAGLDLTGKTAVVTGCNSGIGLETMRVLALRGAHVIGTARTAGKARSACGSVKGKTTPVALELTDFDSVVACANAIQQATSSLDILICNAGIVLGQHEQVRGMEKQFVVNYLGHFLLVHRLLEQVKAAPQGRVVMVGSGDHQHAPTGGIQFDRLSGTGWYQNGYAHSKLACGLLSLELAKRLAKTTTTSNCVTPGHVKTNILRNVKTAYGEHAKTVEQGAATLCYVATNPALEGVSGQYFKDCNPAAQSAYQTDKVMAARLWKISEALTLEFLS